MKSITLKLLIVATLLFTGSPLTADEPKLVPLEAGTADVLKFLGTHAWKWTYRASEPYKKITVRLVWFTRTASGSFERKEFSGDSSSFIDPHISDDILIICGNKNDHATFLVSFGHGTTGPAEHLGIALTDYFRSGNGNGGVPMMIGSEYMLLIRYKDHTATDRKEDLLSYVSVEVETK